MKKKAHVKSKRYRFNQISEKQKISNQKYGDDSMAVLLSSFKPSGLCTAFVNPPLACNDVLIIDDDVQGALNLTVRLIYKVRKKEKSV